MKSDIFLCADQCLIDIRTNRLSLINVHEGMSSGAFPFFIPSLTVVAGMSRNKDEASSQSTILTLFIGEQNILTAPINFEFQDQLRARQVLEFVGLPIASPGKFIARISRDGLDLASWSFDIGSIGQIQSAPPVSPVTATNQKTSEAVSVREQTSNPNTSAQHPKTRRRVKNRDVSE